VDSLKRQTFAATPAESGGLPCELVFWILATAGGALNDWSKTKLTYN
jgi:hypothetical protein